MAYMNADYGQAPSSLSDGAEFRGKFQTLVKGAP